MKLLDAVAAARTRTAGRDRHDAASAPASAAPGPATSVALDVTPQQAYANISALRSQYPGIHGADGFFDAVNPTTGAVGRRYLVLDQSMIMAALDNALQNRALQRYFADDPVSWAAQTYLSLEKMIVD